MQAFVSGSIFNASAHRHVVTARLSARRASFMGAALSSLVVASKRVADSPSRSLSVGPRMAAEPLINLQGKKALVTGIANNRSIAWGIAQSLRAAGAEIGVSYLPINEKMEGKVRELTKPLEPTLFVPCDVQKPEDVEQLAKTVEKEWGNVDVFIHCLAFANRDDLTGEFVNTSRDGFNLALDISAYSLVAMTNALAPLMNDGGSVVTLTYLGSVKYVPNYNVMGVAKAALEASVRYLAAELGPRNIRVNCVSAGAIKTLASSAIGGIGSMIKHAETFAPLRRSTTTTEVGNTAAFLASSASSGITGQVLFVDSGYEIVGATISE